MLTHFIFWAHISLIILLDIYEKRLLYTVLDMLEIRDFTDGVKFELERKSVTFLFKKRREGHSRPRENWEFQSYLRFKTIVRNRARE